MFNDLIKIIPRELKKYVVYGTALLCLTFALFVSPSVFAADFGNGDYGRCPFESDCASTVVTLPPSLQVNINLSNGQVISRNGYTILVTPLNGQSSSFSNVDFYIDGALI